MPGSQLKHSSRGNIIYPGASRKLAFHLQKQDNSDSLIKRQFEELSSVGPVPAQVDIEDTANQKVHQLEGSFDIDWIEYKHENTSPSDTLNLSANRSNFKLGESESRLSQTKRLSSANIDQYRNLISTSGKMQPNITASHPATVGSGRLTGTDSTALDMGDELMNTTSGDYYDDSNLDGQLIDGAPEIKQNLSDDYNRLDEPILDTLLRDLSGIYNKMKIIALPLSSYDIYKIVLRGWDLWGPLLLCTFLAYNLHHSTSQDNHSGPHFADVFVLVWFGSCIVSLNYRLLSISSANNTLVSNQPPPSNIKLQQPASSNQDDKNSNDASKIKGRSQSNIMMPSQYSAPFRTLLSPPSTFQLMCVFGYCLVAPCSGLILLKLFSFDRLFFERIIVGLIFGFAWPTFCSVRILIRYQHPEKRALAIYPIGLFYFVLSCMIILNH